MAEIKIAAEARTEFGKGAARRIRRDNKVPAVLYGHGTEPRHISLPGHELMLALKTANVLLTLDIEGKDQLALPKDVQRDPIKPVIEHIDLVIVRKGEKVTVDVPVHVEGEAAPETVVTVDAQTVQLEVEATNIPENIVVSVEGLEAGTQIKASELELPAGATLVVDEETLVVNITQQISQEALDAEMAEAEAEAGIEHDLSDEEIAEAAEEDAEAADSDSESAEGGDTGSGDTDDES